MSAPFPTELPDPESLLLLGMVAAGLFVGTLGRKTNRKTYQQTVEQRRPTNTPLRSRLWWKIKRPRDLMVLDGVQINRDRKPHCLWLGPTGAGKSTAVAEVRCDGKRPMLIVTPDLSDPLREKADFVWTACVSSPVDFLIGSPTEVAEMLTEVFRSGGTGAWKMAARRATAQVIQMLDASGQPRSLQAIGDLLQEAVATNPSLKRACEGWVERFLSTALQFGPSISSGGIDISALLRQGATVLLDNDAWKHPGLVGDIVALGLAEARRCADLVPGGFRLVFEEAGQLGERIDLADPFFRAGRRRGIAVDALTQAESDLNEAVMSNAATRVYFAPETGSLQKKAADRLKIDADKLDPGSMKDFTAWLTHGKVRKLVKLPKPTGPRSPATGGIHFESTGVSNRWEIIQVEPEEWKWQGTGEPVTYEEPWRKDPIALPAPSIGHQKLLENSVEDGTHLRWTGRHDRDGYGEIWIPGENYRKVHRIAYELAYGAIPRNPDGTTMTVQHQTECPKDCFKLEHLSLLTRAANARDSHTNMRRKIRGVQGGGRKKAREARRST